MILLSIIIPHYNIPSLLVRCIDSIPIRPDVQVIVVDDCSTGAEKYKETIPELNRPYLEFYSTPQWGGAGLVRNIGLKYARGKWLFFADADDFFTGSFQSILDRCSDEADIVYFKANSVKSDDVTRKANRDRRNNSKLDYYLKTKDDFTLRYFHGSSWPLLIRRQMVIDNNIVFHETAYGNDCYFTCCCGYFARRIEVDPAVVYTVTERSGSLCSRKYGNVSPEESRIRMNELVNISEFVYVRTGKFDNTLFSGVFLTWLENHEVAWEMLRIIREKFGLSYLQILGRVFLAVFVKSINALLNRV